MPKSKTAKGNNSTDIISSVGALLKDFEKLGAFPTLVGGMALSILGSQRVTKDFDFLVGKKLRTNKEFIHVMYTHGFELISKLDDLGNVLRTVDNKNVAWAKLQMDPSKSAYFYKKAISLRVDLLFDFPLKAHAVHTRAQAKKVRSYKFYIADKADLIAMKEIAIKDRKQSTDLQDLAFLQKL